jgi:Rho GDP-dissociation inhibitor
VLEKPYCFFPLVVFLTGDLEAFKKQSFILKEGVEYRIKISFKVRAQPK